MRCSLCLTGRSKPSKEYQSNEISTTLNKMLITVIIYFSWSCKSSIYAVLSPSSLAPRALKSWNMYCTLCTAMYVCFKNRAKFFSFCLKRFSKRGKVEHFLSTTALLPQPGISEGKKYVMDIHILEGRNPRRLNKGRILQVLKRWVNLHYKCCILFRIVLALYPHKV